MSYLKESSFLFTFVFQLLNLESDMWKLSEWPALQNLFNLSHEDSEYISCLIQEFSVTWYEGRSSISMHLTW
jgi:hypothetical protein